MCVAKVSRKPGVLGVKALQSRCSAVSCRGGRPRRCPGAGWATRWAHRPADTWTRLDDPACDTHARLMHAWAAGCRGACDAKGGLVRHTCCGADGGGTREVMWQGSRERNGGPLGHGTVTVYISLETVDDGVDVGGALLQLPQAGASRRAHHSLEQRQAVMERATGASGHDAAWPAC